MGIFTTSPEIDNALVNPAQWADESWVHEQFKWLRANAPMQVLAPEGFQPFWNLTRYEDIKTVEQHKKIFINDPRPILSPDMIQAMMEQMSGRKHLVRSLVQMDDPDHMKYRVLTQGWFMGNNLRRLQGRVDALATMYVDRLAELGGECDFVTDVAIWYPLRVIMSILGVPEEDEPLMLKLTQELFGGSDPDTTRSFEMMEFMNVVGDFEDYFRKLTAARRANPTDDVASVIANATVDGAELPDHETNGYYIIIATAGHDTTSSSTSGGLLGLLQHPEQLMRLRQDLDGLLPTAVEEMIRWVTPVRQFMRTATEDYVLAGQKIRAGESLVLWYPSANRDEAVFSNPDRFQVDRADAKQLAFGFGGHVCLGQHLARMEISALFKELLQRVDHIELAGEPQYMQSTFVGGLKSLPIRYKMK